MPVIGNPIWLRRAAAPSGLYLYANGVIETAVSGGLVAVKINGSTGTWTITNANNILTFYDQFTSGTTATTVLFRTVNKIDLGSFTKLTLVVDRDAAPDRSGPVRG